MKIKAYRLAVSARHVLAHFFDGCVRIVWPHLNALRVEFRTFAWVTLLIGGVGALVAVAVALASPGRDDVVQFGSKAASGCENSTHEHYVFLFI